MVTNTDFKKHFLLPALIGAAITYGALSLSDDDSQKSEQMAALENRILDLELLLAQKEEALADARFFSAGAVGVADTATQAPSNATSNQATAATNAQPEHASSALVNSDATLDSQ